MAKRLLIIEDDNSLNQMLQFHFEDQGMDVVGVSHCSDGINHLNRTAFDLILLDQQLPDGTGLELLREIHTQAPTQAIIMMTGQHDLELAIQAIKSGAADFIHKPIKTDQLQIIVDRVLEAQRLSRAVEAMQPETQQATLERTLIGRSSAMLEVSKSIALSADSNANVLITGESGTGKEVVARMIHIHSGRSGPFIAVNCAAIVDTLLESELFGHEKGAFTGAVARKAGKFELAQDGTLFLDEIGELALPLQAKLLRALQEQVFERVGGTQQITTNARIVSATNRDLFAQSGEGMFREDLAYRLNVINIHMPPLRDRLEDIPLLAEALLERIAQKIHKPILPLSEAAQQLLQQHDWPGNVRELENLLTQALVQARNTSQITPDLLPIHYRKTTRPVSGETSPVQAGQIGPDRRCRTLDQVESEHIQQVLYHTSGHKGHSCEILGISRPALDRKIKKYQLQLHH